MELSDDDIQAFADIWKQTFGETLTPDRARTEARRLLDFYAALAEPLPDEEVEEGEGARLRERIGEDPTGWFEPCRDFVSFSTRAVEWFRAGDLAMKRLILEIVGLNPTLKDRILSVEAAKPFQRRVDDDPFPLLCPGGDLNSQPLAGHSPSSCCVNQFRHLGFN